MADQWRKLKVMSDENFRRITGVKKATFALMKECLIPSWKLHRRAGAKPKLDLNNQILLMLCYYREYSSLVQVGTKFGVSESTACRVYQWIESELIANKKFHLKGKKVLLKEGIDAVIVDVSECAIERPTKHRLGRRKNHQKQFYSGKKKKHTLKAQVIIDAKTDEIISTHFGKGRRHDFKLFKESSTQIKAEIKTEVDLGYQGLQKKHTNTKLPHKNSKKKPLTREQKNENKEQASSRVKVEHVFAFLKKFKIISTKYRNRRKKFGLRFNLISAFYNIEKRGEL